MQRKTIILILSLVTLFAFTLAACTNPTGTDGGGSANEDQTGGNGNGNGDDNDNGQTGDDPGDAPKFQFNYLKIEVGTHGFFVGILSEEPTGEELQAADAFVFYVGNGEEDTADQKIDSGTYTSDGTWASNFVPMTLQEGLNKEADTVRFVAAIDDGVVEGEVDTYEHITSGTMIVDYNEQTDIYTFDWTLSFESGNDLSGTYTGKPDDVE
jgi:hypothetical protein